MTLTPVSETAAPVTGIDELDEAIRLARLARPGNPAWASADINIHCRSMADVDAIADAWGVTPYWAAKGTQYAARAGAWPIQVFAVYILREQVTDPAAPGVVAA